jgi:hypothetical protein
LLAWHCAVPEGKLLRLSLPFQKVEQSQAQSVAVGELPTPVIGEGIEGKPNEVLREMIKGGFVGLLPPLPHSFNQGCHRIAENIFSVQFSRCQGGRIGVNLSPSAAERTDDGGHRHLRPAFGAFPRSHPFRPLSPPTQKVNAQFAAQDSVDQGHR